MRKNTKLITLLIVVVFLVFAIGCAKEVEGFDNDVQKKGQGKEENSEEKNEDTVVLKIWSWYSYDEPIKNFEEEN